VGDFVGSSLGGAGGEVALQIGHVVVSLLVIALLFALIFKYLPDVQIGWRDVAIGAVFTAVLFVIGKYLFGLYLSQAAPESSYGAVGALVVVLLWAYYSSQILFLGAEFTQAYSRMYGSRIVPSPEAQPVTEEARAQQGIPRKSA
jgi:membrane protein